MKNNVQNIFLLLEIKQNIKCQFLQANLFKLYIPMTEL